MRTRFIVVSLLIALLPLTALVFGLRRESTRQLGQQYEAQIKTIEHRFQAELKERSDRIDRALLVLREEFLRDNRLRMILEGNRSNALSVEDQRYLIDLGTRVMPLAGLDVFEVQDRDRTILTSGHFREQFGQKGSVWPSEKDLPLLVEVEFPEAKKWMRVRTLLFEIAGREYKLIGGAESLGLPTEKELAQFTPIELGVYRSDGSSLFGDQSGATGEEPLLQRDVAIRLASGYPREVETGTLRIWAPRSLLNDRLASLDRWFLGAALLGVLFAALLASTLARALVRPLDVLADKTTQVRIGRRYVDFRSERTDEIGDLSRFVGSMVSRLQNSAEQLREAERAATLGELARQVHHDIRNGLMPIRNVMRHLSQTAEESSEALSTVFSERKQTIESGLEYLDNLSSNYARLTPRQERVPVDLHAAIRQVADSNGALDVRLSLQAGTPMILADPVGVRRILENLVRNAAEALPPKGGWIHIGTESLETTEEIELFVEDNGVGMDGETRARVFEHFYSTKPTGIGLGLGIVKRLTTDFAGSIDVESTVGEGSCFRLRFPKVSA